MESGFRWIKKPAAIAPGWLEKPERIAALASAESRDFLCHRFEELTVIIGTDPRLQFIHMQLPIRFSHGPFAMAPCGLDAIQRMVPFTFRTLFLGSMMVFRGVLSSETWRAIENYDRACLYAAS